MQCEKCGGALNEKGKCTVCGKKKPRYKGSVVGHSVLLVLAALILVNHLIICATARVMLNQDVLHRALDGFRFSTMQVMQDHEQITLAEYIRREYVTDPQVTTGDVEAVLNQMDLESLTIRKLDNYQNYFRGTEDNLETITPQEIVEILDQNESIIREKLQIEITQGDKDLLVAEMREPCDDYNQGVVHYYNTAFGRFWNRLQLNLWFMLGELVLLVLILIRWCVLFSSGRGKAAHGIRAFGITVLVASGIYLIAGTGGFFSAKYALRELPVLAHITSGVSSPLMIFGGIGVLSSVFLLILASMILSITRKPSPEPEILSEISDAVPDSAEVPVQEPIAVAAGIAEAAVAGEADGTPLTQEETSLPQEDAVESAQPDEASPTQEEASASVEDSEPSVESAQPDDSALQEESAPAFCKECGAKILQPGVQKFCIKCGKQLF